MLSKLAPFRRSKFILPADFFEVFFIILLILLFQVQLWVETQILLTQQLNKRVNLLKKFIKLAAQ